jgi:hypothetical protein
MKIPVEGIVFLWRLFILPITLTDEDKRSEVLSTELLPLWLFFWFIPCSIEMMVIIIPLIILVIAGLAFLLLGESDHDHG